MFFTPDRPLFKRRRYTPVLAAVVTAGILGLSGSKADAQYAPPVSGQFQQLPFGHAVATKVRQMLHGLTETRCIGDTPTQMATFVGIPNNNYHLSEAVRTSLNNIAQESLNRQFAPLLRFNSSQNLSFIAPLNDTGPEGQQRMQQSIDKILRHTPYLLVFKTLRPQKDVVQLQLNLFARPKDGIVRCSKSSSLHVHLPTYKTLNPAKLDSRESRDFVQAKYIYPYVLERFLSDIISYKRLRLVSSFPMEGKCELKRQAPGQFRSTYFRFRNQSASRFNTSRKDWPGLRLHKNQPGEDILALEVEPEEGIMQLRYDLSSIERDVIDLSVEMIKDGDIINSAQMSVFINPQMIAGCTQPETDPLLRFYNGVNSNGLGFNVVADKKRFRVGKDNVTFSITLDEPLHLYCMSVGRDGTANIVYPWKHEQLQQPWPASSRLSYPGSFGFAPIMLRAKAKELFGCYASRNRLPEALETRIINAHRLNQGGGGPNDELTAAEFDRLVIDIEQQADTGAVFTWLRGVRE